MIILGIDPGINGGAAIYNSENAQTSLIDLPITGEGAKKRINVQQFRDWVDIPAIDHCVIERAQAMPDQGASSGFLYGRAVGALEAVVGCSDIPITIIEATAWKKFHNLKGGSKEQSRQRAIQLVPTAAPLMARKMDHGRAEALLMALYGVAILRG